MIYGDLTYDEAAMAVAGRRVGVRIQDLEIDDVVHLYFESGAFMTDVVMKVWNPYAAEVLAYSTSTIGVMPHLRRCEGVSLGEDISGKNIRGTTSLEGYLIIGHRLVMSPFILPPITKIEVNGMDISEAPVSENN